MPLMGNWISLASLFFGHAGAPPADRCRIERLSVSMESGIQVEQKFQRPVILLNVTDAWRARASWTQDSFLDKYGDYVSYVQSQLPPFDVAGKYTLRDIASQPQSSLPLSFNDWLLFSRMRGDITPIPSMLQGVFDQFVFSLGRKNLGAAVHQHSQFWHAQITGRKVWLIADPSKVVPTSMAGCSVLDAIHESRESIQGLQDLDVCETAPGETLYVPNNWHHGTCNVDDFTVAVGGSDDSVAGPLHGACLNCEEQHLLEAFGSHTENINADELLHVASKADCAASIPMIINLRANLVARFHDEQPLHVAAKIGHSSVIASLISQRARLETKSGSRRPVHLAAWMGRVNAVKELLLARSNIAAEADGGEQAIHIATQENHTDVVQLLVSMSASIEAQTDKGYQPIHTAAISGHAAMVEVLTTSRADVTAPYYRGAQPVHLAASAGHAIMIETLAKNGASMSVASELGSQPMHAAALSGHIAVARALAVDPKSLGPSDGRGLRPLHAAAQKGHTDVVDFLATQRASVSVASNAATGQVHPLHLAVQGGYDVLVDLLIRHKASITAVDGKGWQPLHYSAQRGHVSVTKLLTSLRASASAADSQGLTPALIAKYGGHSSVAKLLSSKIASTSNGHRSNMKAQEL